MLNPRHSMTGLISKKRSAQGLGLRKGSQVGCIGEGRQQQRRGQWGRQEMHQRYLLADECGRERERKRDVGVPKGLDLS